MNLRLHLPPQERLVLHHLQTKGRITSCEAQIVYRIRSLSRRITTLCDHGVQLEKLDKKDLTGQRYREYRLISFPAELS